MSERVYLSSVKRLVEEDVARHGFKVTDDILASFQGRVNEILDDPRVNLNDFLLIANLRPSDMSLHAATQSNEEIYSLLRTVGEDYGPHLCYLALKESITQTASDFLACTNEMKRQALIPKKAEEISGIIPDLLNSVPLAHINDPLNTVLDHEQHHQMPHQFKMFGNNGVAEQLAMLSTPTAADSTQHRMPTQSTSDFRPTSDPIEGDSNSNISYPYSPGRQVDSPGHKVDN